MKKIIIIKHGGGELANQLWNYLSIYACGLDKKVSVQNPSFFEYHSFFNFLSKESLTTRVFSQFFKTPRRRSHCINRLGRTLYALRTRIITCIHHRCLVSSENNTNKIIYIDPTQSLLGSYTTCNTLYFSGWLFRNPVGLITFARELHTAFTPQQKIIDKVQSIVAPLRLQYPHIIGLHIRQSDYADFKNGTFVITQDRARTLMQEYIREKSLDVSKTLFIITSDGPIVGDLFKDLNTYISKESSVVDLFLLSSTDTILGSNSSFGAFASWYGNIPHIVMNNDVIDWNYYADKKTFFENKYLTLAHF